MFVFHSVKRIVADRRRNFRGQLMSHFDVERVDAVVADDAVDVAFFAAKAFTITTVVKNNNVKNDNFNKTII